ncbi:hypothetical protein V7112_23295 [Bacillus sp. JJ1566]|uniref:hypothetical protein n=1 Tax=Bacillus sp. JJ1566 TaxID=3122961 RepID=UPI003000ACDE
MLHYIKLARNTENVLLALINALLFFKEDIGTFLYADEKILRKQQRIKIDSMLEIPVSNGLIIKFIVYKKIRICFTNTFDEPELEKQVS